MGLFLTKIHSDESFVCKPDFFLRTQGIGTKTSVLQLLVSLGLFHEEEEHS